MDRMLYLSMNGAKQIMRAQAVNAQNLANVNTAGFREDLNAFRALPLTGPGYASRVYSEDVGNGVNLAPGPLMSTGRELDVAVRGEGYIAVQSLDGSEAYTRAGSLQVSNTGQLLTATGHPVMGTNGPIAISPFEKLEVGTDGTISIRPIGQAAAALAVVGRIKLVKIPDQDVMKGADGLLRNGRSTTTPADATITLEAGYLEGSNVSAIGAMVEMISLSRQYEMQVQMMKTANETQRAGEGLMRIG